MLTLNESGPDRRNLFERVLVQNFSYDNEFDLYENAFVGGTYFYMFSYGWFHTKTHFGTEAPGNSEMAYCGSSHDFTFEIYIFCFPF